MAYGLLIRNSNNEVVIDSEFASLQKIRSGTLTSYSDYTAFDYPYNHRPRLFPYTPSVPNSLLFMQPPLGQFVTAPVAMSDLTGSAAQLNVWSSGTAPIPFMEIVAATSIVGITKPGWGLEIRNAAGDTLFHSGAELMAVDDYWRFEAENGSDQSPGDSYRTMTVGATSWICPHTSSKGYQRVSTGVASSQMYRLIAAICRVNATTVGYKTLTYRRYSLDSDGRGFLFPPTGFFTA